MTIDHIHALPPGTRFEEYRLDEVLGAGGFGITYRAYDGNLDKYVAIKEYLPSEFAARTETSTVVPHSSADVQDYQWGLTRFLDEARTLARFDHPHLNKVHRFFEGNGTAYMVLEYIHGETLAGRLGREPRLSEDTLTRLLEEMLSGLDVVHDAGYVHRDIKPGNLMLRAEDGGAVLLDFGAARQAVGRRSQRLTTILTPGYAPIEQYDSKADDVGPWSDIYALGMVAYRCIIGAGDGELPDAVTRAREQRKGVSDLRSAVEAGRGRYDPKLLAAIDWAIEVDEESRPQGVNEWLKALAGGGRKRRVTKPVRKPATRPAKAPTPERTGMSWSSLALTVVIVVLLGASAWQGWRLYRGIPMVGLDGTETTVESQAGMQAEPQTTDEEASADNTDPEESPSAEQDEVTRLLAAAELDITARRLTSPVGNNAWEKYQRVLSLSPAHPAALAGMERVMGSYLELFGTALAQEDFDKAETYLGRIRKLHPDWPELGDAEQRLAEARQAELERQRREGEARARELAGEMVSIPGGTFSMGDLSGKGYDDEEPVHRVTVPAFNMGKYEVTFTQWDTCVADGGCGRYRPDDAGWGRGNRPVINVSWDNVQTFIFWLNKKTGGNFRLPSEAEWEYAARAGSTTMYSWGNSLGRNRANCDNDSCGDRWDYTAPVGSFRANAWGLHDMYGNVWEWVQDCWNDGYVGAPNDGSTWELGNCGRRVFRGGSWYNTPGGLRSADRGWNTRSDRDYFIGFRLAQDK